MRRIEEIINRFEKMMEDLDNKVKNKRGKLDMHS